MLRPVGRRLTCWRKQAGSCLELAARLLEVAVKTCRGPVNSGRAARQRSAGIGGGCIFGRGCGGLLSRAVRLQKHPEKGFPGCVLACCLRDAELEAIGSIFSLSELGGVSLSGNKDAKMGWILPPQNLRRSGSACLARSAAQVASPLFHLTLSIHSSTASLLRLQGREPWSKNEIRPRGPSSKHFVRKNPAAYCWPSFFPFPFPPFKPRSSLLIPTFLFLLILSPPSLL
ncbi:hypothetical protein B0J15DRAFT_488254, partial [Fusarium solani]